jgi:hypothetical protein
MSNVIESNSAKLRELHSAVKIAYKKYQEGARQHIFDLNPRRHMVEAHARLCRQLYAAA